MNKLLKQYDRLSKKSGNILSQFKQAKEDLTVHIAAQEQLEVEIVEEIRQQEELLATVFKDIEANKTVLGNITEFLGQ